jgi:protein-glutamine gamma-glutamyltransferase
VSAARADALPLPRLLWTAGCCALAVLASLPILPLWVIAIAYIAGGARILLAIRLQGPPPRAVLLGAAALPIALLLLRFHTFNGITAGTALLCLMGGLKLLETRSVRDLRVVLLIVYFLCLAALLRSESFWQLAYLISVCWLATAALMQLTAGAPGPHWRASLRHAGRILLQALPLTLFLWLLFPRLTEPLWRVNDDSSIAVTGLSDSMDPGDISDLVLSDDIAFRVRFTGPIPPQRDRYWRGPVLEVFNGHLWRRSDRAGFTGAESAPPPPAAVLYGYTIGLEPYPHNWIYALERPVHWDLARARLSDSGVLERADPVSQPLDVSMTSVAGALAPGTLPEYLRARNLALPKERNPRTALLARQMRAAHPQARDYVRSVLSMLHDQAFFYTLTPPRLGENSVDDFLFDSRRGFCGHYASAFAVMMRAAGIPARVVTGYLGGMENPYGHYWTVRQSDAHAWVEVWLEGSGWSRVDPTAAIASNRIEQQGAVENIDALLGIELRARGSWLADVSMRLDALRQIWRERILQFDQDTQQSLLQQLMIPLPDTGKYALLVALCLCGAFGWMAWQARRDRALPAHDSLARALHRLCGRLAGIGLRRLPYEGAEAFAARAGLARPDLADGLRALMRRYSDLRYGAGPPARGAVARLRRSMRRFSLSCGGGCPDTSSSGPRCS